MLAYAVIASIVFYFFALYLRRTSLEKEDIFDALATVAIIILCGGFVVYSLADTQIPHSSPVTVMYYAEPKTTPVAPTPKKPLIPDGPSRRLSEPAKDVEGLVKWASIEKGVFDISEAWVGHDESISRYNFHGRVNNKSDKIIAGLEIEVIIHDCGRADGDRKHCPIVGTPILETAVGTVVQPNASDDFSVRLPFFGPRDNYEFEIRPTRVAEWRGPPISTKHVVINAGLSNGYYIYDNIDKVSTCGSMPDQPIPSQIDEQSAEILRADLEQPRSC
jgi:hypothetical protein